jgi:hypothetical protein
VDGIVTFGQAKESSGGGFGARNGRKAGLEKIRVFLKKRTQWVFCLFFWFFGVFWDFFCIYICPEERVFRVFSVSRTLLGASRL